MLSSVIKVLVGFVLLPCQVNMFELRDYWDSWEKLDQVVWVVVGEVGQEEQYSGDWVDIEKQEDFGDQGGQGWEIVSR